MKLKDIAEIQIGYQQRDKTRPTSNGAYHIIHIKDLDLEGQFKDAVIERGGTAPYVWTGNLDRITPTGDAERYRVKQGDVLFLSRGQRTCAVAISEPLQNTIASYYFYILRPDPQRITPAYLAWFINQPTTQAHLERQLHGSHIKIIPKSAFARLEVALPPLCTQRTIVKLERLRQKEAYLMRRLAVARKRLLDRTALCASIINEQLSMNNEQGRGECGI